MTYKCTITSGGGTEYDGGDFEIKETPKRITFVCVRYPFHENEMTQTTKHKSVEGLRVARPIVINKFYSQTRVREDGNYNAVREVEDNGILHRGYFNNGHVARYWYDNTWTIYPNQSGTPHYLEPIL